MEELNTVEYGKISMERLLKTVNKNRDDKTDYYRSIGKHQVGVASEEITLKEYKGFKIGDEVTVLQKPKMWSANAGKYPFDNLQVGQTAHVKEYPFTGKIKKLTTFFLSDENSGIYKLTALGGVGVGIDGFGFDLDELIERKLIKSDTVDLGIPDSLPKGKKVKSVNDLVIGRKYMPIKHDEFRGKELILQDIHNLNELELYKSWNFHDRNAWIKISEVQEVSNQPSPSKLTLDLIKKLRNERYIYGYDGGPGGGGGGTIDTVATPVLPGFNKDGSEFIFIKVDGLRRRFNPDKIQKLFDEGSVSQSFKATEYSTITTELKLIQDKTKLPKHSSWTTMRD